MNDDQKHNQMKVFTYEDTKFVEVQEVFTSSNYDYITFHHNNKIFKIDMSIENRKRKTVEDDFEEKNIMLLDENKYIKERMVQLEAITNLLVKKIAKSNLTDSESVEIRKIILKKTKLKDKRK